MFLLRSRAFIEINQEMLLLAGQMIFTFAEVERHLRKSDVRQDFLGEVIRHVAD